MAQQLPEGFTSGGGEGASEQQQQQAAMEEQLDAIVGSILTPEAKDRLDRLAIVKKEKTQEIKLQLAEKARSGEIRSRVTEEQLISMLEVCRVENTGTRRLTLLF